MQVHDIWGVAGLGLVLAMVVAIIKPGSAADGVIKASADGFTRFTQAATQQTVTA